MESKDLMTKHEQIIRYIQNLSVGTRISVRKIAQALEVSEGTAYRAIKEAENRGIVSTKERTGTLRVERKQHQHIDKLTFAEVVNIVDGAVLGGAKGLQKTLNKFVIGAMEQEAMMRYIDSGNLLIVGNRNKAHICALGLGAGVLITGGFDASDEVKKLADELELPIISSTYDTFTVATLINRAIYDRLIKKKILIVEDIIRTDIPLASLKGTSTVRDMQKLMKETGHSRFPVVDENNRLIGIMTTRDIIAADPDQTVDKLMTTNPITINAQTSVASAGHMMVWEGIELLPVVDSTRTLLGVISRKDVLKAMQYIQKQPQNGETFEDLIWSGFEEMRNKEGKLFFRGVITPQMTNHVGMISEGVLSTLMTRVAYRTVKEHKRGDLLVDSSSTYYLMPVQIDSVVDIVPTVIEISRRFCKIDIEIYDKDTRVAKSIITARLIDHF
jgi:predicted transcriptional regulator